MYSDKSPSLWFFGEHPPISGNHQGDGLTEVTLPWKQSVKHVSAGRHHVVAVTTAGKGMYEVSVCIHLTTPFIIT